MKFRIGSSNWDTIFDVDVVNDNDELVLHVKIDYTQDDADCKISLSGYDTKLPHANAHAFYATIAADIDTEIQNLFGE